jgi:hypothetical protein
MQDLNAFSCRYLKKYKSITARYDLEMKKLDERLTASGKSSSLIEVGCIPLRWLCCSQNIILIGYLLETMFRCAFASSAGIQRGCQLSFWVLSISMYATVLAALVHWLYGPVKNSPGILAAYYSLLAPSLRENRLLALRLFLISGVLLSLWYVPGTATAPLALIFLVMLNLTVYRITGKLKASYVAEIFTRD